MTAIKRAERVELIAVDALTPYVRNSRTHSDVQVAQIAASIREFGFTNPLLVDASGGIIAGHGRLLGALALGMADVPCIRLGHLSPEQRRAYVIADNKLAENAEWDEDMLALELRELGDMEFDLGLTGFGTDEIAELLAQADATTESRMDPDDVPVAEDDTVTRPGDVWIIGRHRVVCGDATDPQVCAKLLGGERADLCWTDPPYNVGYRAVAGAIDNDDMSAAEFLEFLRKVFRVIASAMKPGAAIYVSHADSGETGVSFRRAFLDAGFHLAACLIWRKDSFVLGRSDYQWIHEPILYGWRLGGGHKWFGGRKQRSLNDLGSSESPFVQLPDGRWQITIGEEVMVIDGAATVEYVEHSVLSELRPKRSALHPTMKPVALIERMLKNNAKPGALMLDAFGGSGSTVIAAERAGLGARVIELSPRFVDVIVRRWQAYTDGEATLEGSGMKFGSVARNVSRKT